jgi:VWFA-related protein
MARRAIPAALALALAAALHAQTDPTQSAVPEAGFSPPAAATAAATTTPTIRVFSRETIIDVLVTDDKGNPVHGLTRSDFTVLEDSHPLSIRSFAENSTTAPPPPPTLPPNTYTNARAIPATGPVQIFLFDLIGSPPAIMERASKYIADYLRTMPAGTQVALFGLYPREDFVLLHDFTTDGPSAAATVDKLNVEWIHDPLDPRTARDMLIAAMNNIANDVAGIHGRKNLIWVVPGTPLQINRDGGLSCSVGPPDMTIVHRLMDLYDRFTQEQIALYPLDPFGIHAPSGKCGPEDIADGTGGLSDNTNDYKAEAAKFVDSTSHFYTLSYVPPRPQDDGHFHAINIQIDRPGVHLTYRTGYNDEQPHPLDPTVIHDMIQGPMRTGALPATQLLFTLQVTPAPAGQTESTSPKLNITDKHHAGSSKDRPYNAVFTFDPTQIDFSETPDGKRTAKIEFDLGIFDSFSQLGPVRSQVITLNVSPSGYDDFMRKPFHFTLPIPIPKGQQTLRAGLFDTVSGKAGTLEIPLTIPKR